MQPGVVTLYRSGQYLEVIPAVPAIDEALFTKFHKPGADPTFGHRVELRPCALFDAKTDLDGVPYLLGWAGLERLIQELLQATGYEVEFTGKRRSALPQPDLDRLGGIADLDLGLLNMVRQHDRGLIHYDPEQVDSARCIAQIARAWPRKKIVITATRMDTVRSLAARLREDRFKVATFSARRQSNQYRQIALCTFALVANGDVRAEARDIYLTVNPTELFTGYMAFGLEGLNCVPRARFYGLLSDKVRIAPAQRPLLMALFGLEAVHIPRHGHQPLRADVIFTRIDGGHRPPNHKDVLLIKRLGLWEHPVRNRRIARLFELLVRADRRALRRQFPEVAEHIPGKPKRRIGVLVENVEHGLTLRARLPGVPLITGKVWTAGMAAEEAEYFAARAGRDRVREHAIVTHQGLAHAGRFDILIRGDGGTGLPPLPEPQLVVSCNDARRFFVIDCDDRHHPLLRQWSRSRRHAYERAGWHVAGAAAPTLVEEYFARVAEGW
jgi:hypothetical protein